MRIQRWPAGEHQGAQLLRRHRVGGLTCSFFALFTRSFSEAPCSSPAAAAAAAAASFRAAVAWALACSRPALSSASPRDRLGGRLAVGAGARAIPIGQQAGERRPQRGEGRLLGQRVPDGDADPARAFGLRGADCGGEEQGSSQEQRRLDGAHVISGAARTAVPGEGEQGACRQGVEGSCIHRAGRSVPDPPGRREPVTPGTGARTPAPPVRCAGARDGGERNGTAAARSGTPPAPTAPQTGLSRDPGWRYVGCSRVGQQNDPRRTREETPMKAFRSSLAVSLALLALSCGGSRQQGLRHAHGAPQGRSGEVRRRGRHHLGDRPRGSRRHPGAEHAPRRPPTYSSSPTTPPRW